MKLTHDACGTGLLLAKHNAATQLTKQNILRRGLLALARLTHRGGDVGDSCSDGSGVHFEIPWHIVLSQADSQTFDANATRIVGFFFLSASEEDRNGQLQLLEETAAKCGLIQIAKRIAPINKQVLPAQSQANCPVPMQITFVPLKEPQNEEREQFVNRCRFAFLAACVNETQRAKFCKTRPVIASFSHRSIIYKALVNGAQLPDFYLDLADETIETRFVLFHQRFATNTHPEWELVQPFDVLAHNGEINTIRANAERLTMRLQRLFPEDSEGRPFEPSLWFSGEQSDSRILNLAMQLMLFEGIPLSAAISSAIAPLAREDEETANSESAGRYEKFQEFATKQRNLYELWDGPVALVFTDGLNLGAALDRNALRPLRQIEDDNSVGIASELGVFDFDSSSSCQTSRIGPGEIVYFAGEQGRRACATELQQEICQVLEKLAAGYRWKSLQTDILESAPETKHFLLEDFQPKNDNHRYFGFFDETLGKIYSDLVQKGTEPTFSMGNDAPLAPLSKGCRSFFDYFRQRFAQVTNPPIDPVRELCLFDMSSYFGFGYGSCEGKPDLVPIRMSISCPVLGPEQFAALFNEAFTVSSHPVLNFDLEYPRILNLNAKVDLFCERFERIIAKLKKSHAMILLSDKATSQEKAAFPVLLAVSALHTKLVQQGKRAEVGIIVHSGQIRNSHDLSCLFALGADAAYPFALFSYANSLALGVSGAPTNETRLHADPHTPLAKAHNALVCGLRKTMSRSGISQFSSFKSCYAVDAFGLSLDLCRTWLGMVRGRYGRLGLVEVIRENDELFDLHLQMELEEHARRVRVATVSRWSAFGEKRTYNPESISMLRTAVLRDSILDYRRFVELIEKQDKLGLTLRGLLTLKVSANPLPLAQVEPLADIFARLSIGAMSVGALSPEAHLTLSLAAKELGIKSNSGEGGESDDCPSYIRQVASGRFGVTLNYLLRAKEIQIKIAQGAKPGEGGQLPANKVSAEISALRHTQKGVGLISPPPHHDIYSIEDLKQLIYDLRRANPEARIGVKLVSTSGVGHIAVGVAKAGADTITIAGHDGGTGAASLYSINHVGEPWEMGLIDAHDELNANGLRHKVRLVVDGQIRSARDVIFASVLGADEFSLATAPLVAMGCMLMRKCHLNTCPVGIATQDERLRKGFAGKTFHVTRYFNFLGNEIREFLGKLGVRSLSELRAQRNLLGIETSKLSDHWKTRKIDVRQLLFATMTPYSKPKVLLKPDKEVSDAEDKLIASLPNLLSEKASKDLFLETTLTNTDLTFGTAICSALHRLFPGFRQQLVIQCTGTAGQSFGSFITSQLKLVMTGPANDGVGKGLSGGSIVLRSPFNASELKIQSIAGNACFYGATSGKAYLAGLAGDRFAVRNSGAELVVDGVGDHGCEYMTGGVVFVLGCYGKNMCAGMTGGEVFFFQGQKSFSKDVRVFERLGLRERKRAHELLQAHVSESRSRLGQFVLEHWNEFEGRLCMALPLDKGYKSEELQKSTEIQKGYADAVWKNFSDLSPSMQAQLIRELSVRSIEELV